MIKNLKIYMLYLRFLSIWKPNCHLWRGRICLYYYLRRSLKILHIIAWYFAVWRLRVWFSIAHQYLNEGYSMLVNDLGLIQRRDHIRALSKQHWSFVCCSYSSSKYNAKIWSWQNIFNVLKGDDQHKYEKGNYSDGSLKIIYRYSDNYLDLDLKL